MTVNVSIQALRRFVSRDDDSSIMYSDNGSNNIKAKKELEILFIVFEIQFIRK